MADFNPNTKSFSECVAQLKETVQRAGLDPKMIVTSRDAASAKLRNEMKFKNVPDGFTKWQLPIRRWQRQTKLDAIYEETGETFNSRENKRDQSL